MQRQPVVGALDDSDTTDGLQYRINSASATIPRQSKAV